MFENELISELVRALTIIESGCFWFIESAIAVNFIGFTLADNNRVASMADNNNVATQS